MRVMLLKMVGLLKTILLLQKKKINYYIMVALQEKILYLLLVERLEMRRIMGKIFLLNILE